MYIFFNYKNIKEIKN